MKTMIAVNLGIQADNDMLRAAASASSLLDIEAWIDDYVVEQVGSKGEVVALFDADLPDFVRVMNNAFMLVRSTAFAGIELSVRSLQADTFVQASFGQIPALPSGPWPQSKADLDDYDPHRTLMMC